MNPSIKFNTGSSGTPGESIKFPIQVILERAGSLAPSLFLIDSYNLSKTTLPNCKQPKPLFNSFLFYNHFTNICRFPLLNKVLKA